MVETFSGIGQASDWLDDDYEAEIMNENIVYTANHSERTSCLSGDPMRNISSR